MTIDQQLKQLAACDYPHKVDVVDAVMRQVAAKPYLQPVHRKMNWRLVGTTAAAAVALAFVVNIALFNTRSYDEEGLGSMIAQVNDYSSWNTIESAADENPIEYLYDE